MKGFIIGSPHRERFAALQGKLSPPDFPYLIQIHKITVVTACKLPHRKLLFKIRKRKIIGAVILIAIIVVAIVIKNGKSFTTINVYGAVGGGKEDLLADEEINKIFGILKPLFWIYIKISYPISQTFLPNKTDFLPQ